MGTPSHNGNLCYSTAFLMSLHPLLQNKKPDSDTTNTEVLLAS